MTENIINTRTTYADDNVCHFVMDDEYCDLKCGECNGCNDKNNYFKITDYGDSIEISYYRNIGGLTVHSLSERIDKKTFLQI